MAIKGAKTGDKRKATIAGDKAEKKSVAKKNAPESTRKMWRNDDASDDSSDDDDSSPDGEDAGAALPAKKKVRQAREDSDANQNAGKKAERSVYQKTKMLTAPQLYADFP